jgi:hypothetical protein
MGPRWAPKALLTDAKRAVALWRSVRTTELQAAAVASPVYGLPPLTRLEQLPVLLPLTLAGGQSSFERNTHGASSGNADRDNFLYVSGGEKVMLDQPGPETVYRIWVTGFDPATAWLRVYFDGETAPRINLLLRELFAGTRAPFLSPLVAGSTRSSGGFVCYLPLPYRRSIKIATNMSGYYDIGYHTYSPDTVVTTWTGTEDSTAARAAWSNSGAARRRPASTPRSVRSSEWGSSGRIPPARALHDDEPAAPVAEFTTTCRFPPCIATMPLRLNAGDGSNVISGATERAETSPLPACDPGGREAPQRRSDRIGDPDVAGSGHDEVVEERGGFRGRERADLFTARHVVHPYIAGRAARHVQQIAKDLPPHGGFARPRDERRDHRVIKGAAVDRAVAEGADEERPAPQWSPGPVPRSRRPEPPPRSRRGPRRRAEGGRA